MSNSYLPDTDEQVEKKSPRQLLLLVLLLLIAVFAYLYFFTGLIKPREEAAQPQTAPEAQVKRPLPPRPQQTAQAGNAAAPEEGAKAEKPATPPAKVAEPKAAAQPKKPEPPPVKEAHPTKPAPVEKPAAAAKAAPPQKVKPAPPAEAKGAKPAKPAPEVKAAKEKAPEAKGAKEAKGTKEAKGAKEGKPAQGKAVAAAAVAKAPSAKGSEKGTEGAQKGAPAAKSASAPYTLVINDVPESEGNSVVAKLKKAGISKVVQTRMKKGETMHRLYLADFANHDEAQEELDRLKAVAPSAFILPEKGRYTVYAGSYLREKKAALEQDRLFDHGVKLLLKTATAPVSVIKVQAGGFANKASAEKAATALKTSGVVAEVVKTQQQ